MATFIQPVLLTMPDATGRAWFEPYTILATGEIWAHPVLRLAAPTTGQEHGAYGVFRVPQNYVSTPVIVVSWSQVGAADQSARLKVNTRAVAVGESLDQTGTSGDYSSVLVTTGTGIGHEHWRITSSFTLTQTFAVDDLVECYVARLSDGGTDTLAQAVAIHAVGFSYADA